MPEECLIKKYPNRRLYNTNTSKYITLDDIRQMVLEEMPFKVVEQKTGEDITRNILLQVIMDQETAGGEPMFSSELLMQFIRNYAEGTRDSFVDFMEQSLEFYNKQQTLMRDQLSDTFKGTPSELWLKMGKKHMSAWEDMNKEFFKSLFAANKNRRP